MRKILGISCIALLLITGVAAAKSIAGVSGFIINVNQTIAGGASYTVPLTSSQFMPNVAYDITCHVTDTNYYSTPDPVGMSAVFNPASGHYQSLDTYFNGSFYSYSNRVQGFLTQADNTLTFSGYIKDPSNKDSLTFKDTDKNGHAATLTQCVVTLNTN